ncbi:nucleotidyltransferase family protein [Cupriavidus basilensis]|uniref:Nucleotidyltransferase family protein n=1 Tax=Cupriavidus basilensis TaxID=68895 RepID=A0ABT6AZK5_9BURK|nr:nucleotidyltransferase family protein [Cupriavidus basilensis]MDF3838052.1 nucleotidyltransferase family protein [Cupriavidus basilensis]
MEAIILAGGLGTRLREVVADVPKVMAPVAGRPFLEILLATLARKGFTRVVLSLGYLADKVMGHFGSSFGSMELVYEVENVPLGTGGAMRAALNRCKSEHVFVFNGDTFLDLEVGDVELDWSRHRAPIIVAREVPDTKRYGRLDTLSGRVLGFAEKGMSGPGLINAGCYVLPRGILDQFELGRTFSFETGYLADAVKEQQFNVFVTRGYFIDIGVPEDYARAQGELAGIGE